MDKYDILNDFRAFLDEWQRNNPLPDSDGTIASVADRIGLFAEKIKEFNEIITQKRNELINNASDTDKEEINTIIVSETRDFIVRYYYAE